MSKIINFKDTDQAVKEIAELLNRTVITEQQKEIDQLKDRLTTAIFALQMIANDEYKHPAQGAKIALQEIDRKEAKNGNTDLPTQG